MLAERYPSPTVSALIILLSLALGLGPGVLASLILAL